MSKGNGSTSTPVGVLSDLIARLAAITPEQFVAPVDGLGKGDVAVTVANDDIKRLFMLRGILSKKCRELSRSGIKMAEENLMKVMYGNPEAMVKELEDPVSSISKARAEIERLSLELHQMDALHKIVDGILWLEVRRQHPDLANKRQVGIRADWALCSCEEDDDDDSGMSVRILAFGSSDLPAELAELFNQSMPLH